MTNRCKSAIIAACVATLLPVASFAQTVCAERARVLEKLETQFGETRTSIGLSTNNRVMEMFASSETGSWTITVTTPNGKTCLLASGRAFEEMAKEQLSSLDSET